MSSKKRKRWSPPPPPGPKFCCARCFDDDVLTEFIAKTATYEDMCWYCGNRGKLVGARKLQPLFRPLIEAYEEATPGAFLSRLLRKDWDIFAPVSSRKAGWLLENILDDPKFNTAKFRRREPAQPVPAWDWREIQREIIERNRWFHKTQIETERFEKLLKAVAVTADKLDMNWFRARLIEDGDAPYPADKMKSPPKENATGGRANPVRIPYLYLNSDVDTTINEIRPHAGEKLRIARFKLRPVKLVDLTRTRKSHLSPFKYDDVGLIRMHLQDASFLDVLNKALSDPIIPSRREYEYLPTQFICEFIKNQEFQGVLYRSHFGAGTNLVLFDDANAEVTGLRTDKISNVHAQHDCDPGGSSQEESWEPVLPVSNANPGHKEPNKADVSAAEQKNHSREAISGLARLAVASNALASTVGVGNEKEN